VKIFCIGLNKTGTSSLHRALETMGFRSLHFGGPAVRQTIQRADSEGRPLVEDFDEYDAFSDILYLSQRYAQLDRQYPGAKFILTTRPLDDWLASRRRHVERNVELKARGLYDRGFVTVDLDAWRAEYEEHHARVREYFAERPDDLLEMDITNGDGYDRLCPFLGVAVPGSEFPWRNQGDVEAERIASIASPTSAALREQIEQERAERQRIELQYRSLRRRRAVAIALRVNRRIHTAERRLRRLVQKARSHR
jgi:hypothetical protein